MNLGVFKWRILLWSLSIEWLLLYSPPYWPNRSVSYFRVIKDSTVIKSGRKRGKFKDLNGSFVNGKRWNSLQDPSPSTSISSISIKIQKCLQVNFWRFMEDGSLVVILNKDLVPRLFIFHLSSLQDHDIL